MILRNLNAVDGSGAITLGTPYVGVLGSAIPVDSYIYPSLDLPADLVKYYRGEVVTWPAQGTLTVFENGAYDYDSTGVVGQQSFTVQLYEDDTALGTPITVSIDVQSNATVTGVSVSPATASVAGNTTRQFSASVTGTNSPPNTVTWEVTPIVPGVSINATGLFQAPASTASNQTFTVTARSTFDTGKAGSATVTVPATAFSQYPNPSDVRAGVLYGASGEFTGSMVASGSGSPITIVLGGGVGINSDGTLSIGMLH